MAVGAAAGFGFALGLGIERPVWWLSSAFGGLLGAVAAAVLYEFVGAIAFPLDKTSEPVSATIGTRLFAQLVVAVLTAAGAIMVQLASSRNATRGA